ncbi:Hypothetical protein IALB_1232 [Ignavibacterium album JCM 16511]|uniref:Smf/DprA SLOG domain-containing protein n=1 Tax=Ignavibacterium album (strain DSM 19864 / JCM 16511 / NBRC 101810 / Mat9-16) TaxID=945713 RepID=I0AIY6_IGNAJ|nr:DNA-processing protein DprA [Ignavibacterium album]AFH48943.1 Hypothetical protein IALB_1232 [Ignavibacterium album JCM 16511]
MYYLGNKEILNNYKIGFLCSRKVPAGIILKTYDWAVEQRDKGNCIVSGFHSKIEKDVFDILVKGSQPIILVLAKGMMKRWDKKIIELVNQNRLLIISLFSEKVTRPTIKTAIKRNELIAEISDKIFIPYFSPNSYLQTLYDNYKLKVLTL